MFVVSSLLIKLEMAEKQILNHPGSIKEQVYHEQLVHLQSQLNDLYQENNTEFKAGVEKLKNRLTDRLEAAEILKTFELERIESDFKSEQEILKKELEEKKSELMEVFLTDLEEKRQQIKHEYQSMDLSGECVDLKPMSTRKLRRRPNEPLPRDEKRQRKSSPSMNYLLTESEVNEDLIALGCPVSTLKNSDKGSSLGSGSQSPMRSSQTPVSIYRAVISVGDLDAYIDNGKLYFDTKCYLRGQTVFAEACDIGKVPAVIQSISASEVKVLFM